MRAVTACAGSPGSTSIGLPTRMVMGKWLRRRSFGCPLVHTRWVPHRATGSIGTWASCAMRAAPVLNFLSVKDCEIVASGKTPTISPRRSASTACRKACSPWARSTGMCFIARISGPDTLWRKTDSLAMNRTSRLDGRADTPAKTKSRYPMWLLTRTAPPSRGTCSSPLMSKRRSSALNRVRAAPTTGGYTSSAM